MTTEIQTSGTRSVRLAFACPSYGPIDSRALRSQRAAVMHASNRGVLWLGDVSPERMLIDGARNTVIKQYLGGVHELQKSEPDKVQGLFWVDNDIVLPIDAITRLADALLRGHDFVTGIYVQRMRPHWPLIANFDSKRETFRWLVDWPENTLAPVDGCGFGVAVTSAKLLGAMADNYPNPFEFTKYSEDFTFCRRAAILGYQLYVDTGVQCGHLMDPEPATVAHFKAVVAAGPHRIQSPQSASGGDDGHGAGDDRSGQ